MALGRPAASGLGKRVVLPAAMLLAVGLAPARAAAQAQAPSARADQIDLSRIFQVVPDLVSSAFSKGHTELFRLIEDLQLLDMDAEIDRYVGDPRELNDSTAYKLSLLPFHIRYPTYRDLVDQMTRLDSVRSRRIYTVTPDSVHLIDLRIQPVETLDELAGFGVGQEVERSLLSHFSARELADLGVFLISQQPLFPETDEDWQRLKHRIARGSVALAMGALAAGAAFDAASFTHAGTIVRSGERLRLGYYGGFRDLGTHLHPFLRAGLTLAASGLEVAAGVADQIRPTPSQVDRALEVAVREGLLNQLARPLGWDAFFEAAVSRSIHEPAGFTGDRTSARAGFFFKRDRLPALPDVVLRGSTEAATNLEGRIQSAAAIGLEHAPSGVATMVQASRTPPGTSAGTGATSAVNDDRLTLFLAGTMEPISAQFVAAMHGNARLVEVEWEGLLGVEQRKAEWEQRLVAGASTRTPEEAQRDLRELARMIGEREARLANLATLLGDYLESRRRAYGILGWSAAPDNLHGPLAASVLVAARDRVFDRLTVLSRDLEAALGRLAPLQARVTRLQDDIAALAARSPGDPELGGKRALLASLQGEWNRESEVVKRSLDACDHFRTESRRILAASGSRGRNLPPVPGVLSPHARRQIAWLTLFVQP
jgi:hypothetical protein